MEIDANGDPGQRDRGQELGHYKADHAGRLMKARKITLAGQDYYLVFNGAAMFEVNDRFGSASELLEAIGKTGRDGFQALCNGLALLSEQGELARRALGYDKGPILQADTARALIEPKETTPMRAALSAAILAGFGREVESNEDVDLGLIELAQKTNG